MEFHSEAVFPSIQNQELNHVAQDISSIQPTFPFGMEQCHESNVC